MGGGGTGGFALALGGAGGSGAAGFSGSVSSAAGSGGGSLRSFAIGPSSVITAIPMSVGFRMGAFFLGPAASFASFSAIDL